MDEAFRTELRNTIRNLADPALRERLNLERGALAGKIDRAEKQLDRDRDRLALLDIAFDAVGVAAQQRAGAVFQGCSAEEVANV